MIMNMKRYKKLKQINTCPVIMNMTRYKKYKQIVTCPVIMNMKRYLTDLSCLHLCVRVYTCVHVYTYIFASDLYMHTYAYIQMCICLYLTYTYIPTYICIYQLIYIYIPCFSAAYTSCIKNSALVTMDSRCKTC